MHIDLNNDNLFELNVSHIYSNPLCSWFYLLPVDICSGDYGIVQRNLTEAYSTALPSSISEQSTENNAENLIVFELKGFSSWFTAEGVASFFLSTTNSMNDEDIVEMNVTSMYLITLSSFSWLGSTQASAKCPNISVHNISSMYSVPIISRFPSMLSISLHTKVRLLNSILLIVILLSCDHQFDVTSCRLATKTGMHQNSLFLLYIQKRPHHHFGRNSTSSLNESAVFEQNPTEIYFPSS